MTQTHWEWIRENGLCLAGPAWSSEQQAQRNWLTPGWEFLLHWAEMSTSGHSAVSHSLSRSFMHMYQLIGKINSNLTRLSLQVTPANSKRKLSHPDTQQLSSAQEERVETEDVQTGNHLNASTSDRLDTNCLVQKQKGRKKKLPVVEHNQNNDSLKLKD